jgi:superfamily I DNA/RNA helicase
LRLAGFSHDAYTCYLRTGGSLENYDIFFYERDSEQLESIVRELTLFRSRGYRASEITLLSMRSDPRSAAVRLTQAGNRFRPAWQGGEQTSFASIHAFKGMENKVVFLTDVLLDDEEFSRDVFYTGLTRATESVRVFCDKRSQAALVSWLGAKATP